MLPRGKYTSHVAATDGVLTATQTVTVETEAFRITPSDTTPGRGQSITITVKSAETLAKAPLVWVYPAGRRRLERPDEQDRAEVPTR